MAGTINPQWLADCRINESVDSKVEDWIASLRNANKVEIHEGGHVWVDGPGGGYWLSQEQVDDACLRIDAGV